MANRYDTTTFIIPTRGAWEKVLQRTMLQLGQERTFVFPYHFETHQSAMCIEVVECGVHAPQTLLNYSGEDAVYVVLEREDYGWTETAIINCEVLNFASYPSPYEDELSPDASCEEARLKRLTLGLQAFVPPIQFAAEWNNALPTILKALPVGYATFAADSSILHWE